MAAKYYAVKRGRTKGIFYSWSDCKKMVDDFPGAVYKGFTSVAEADAFISGMLPAGKEHAAEEKEPEVYAFVDGSFHSVTKVYGYGGFLVHHGQKEVLQGAGDDAEMAAMRNVAGEISGAMAAVKKALELGFTELTIYYDYMGIEMWADGSWKRNKKGTIAYYDYMQSVKDKISVKFVKVKGHSGVEGNEEADKLAKAAVGIDPE